jgi:hypothetical protein
MPAEYACTVASYKGHRTIIPEQGTCREREVKTADSYNHDLYLIKTS